MTVRIEITHTFPVPVSEAFSYITDLAFIAMAVFVAWGRLGDYPL